MDLFRIWDGLCSFFHQNSKRHSWKCSFTSNGESTRFELFRLYWWWFFTRIFEAPFVVFTFPLHLVCQRLNRVSELWFQSQQTVFKGLTKPKESYQNSKIRYYYQSERKCKRKMSSYSQQIKIHVTPTFFSRGGGVSCHLFLIAICGPW